MDTHCARCNAPITCEPDGKCWCADLPSRLSAPTTGGCLCRNCLEHDLKVEKETQRESSRDHA